MRNTLSILECGSSLIVTVYECHTFHLLQHCAGAFTLAFHSYSLDAPYSIRYRLTKDGKSCVFNLRVV